MGISPIPLGVVLLALLSACEDGGVAPTSDALAEGPWVQVSSGGAHSCAISAEGRIACWGSNGSGQLGFAGGGVWSTPRLVAAEGPWVSVAAGGRHTCAVDAGGGVWCWGGNEWGQLADGGAEASGIAARADPERVPVGGRYASVTAGDGHSCALSTLGEAVCWGASDAGQSAGDGAAGPPVRPTLVPGGPWRGLAAGARHTCAVTAEGSASCWGANGALEIGAAVPFAPRLAVSRVAGLILLRSVTAGTATSCGLDLGQRVYCWGDNAAGQAAPAGDRIGSPALRDAGPATGVSVGEGWSCVLGATGGVRCWGARWDLPGSSRPAVEAGGWDVPLESAATLSLGARHGCAVTRQGRLTCWGSPAGGRLGPFGG